MGYPTRVLTKGGTTTRIDVYHHLAGPVDDPRLDEILLLLHRITKVERTILMDLTALTDEVTNNTTVTGSVQALVQRLADEIAAAGGDQAALDALVQTLKDNDAALAAAVAANTPGEPTT